MTNISYCSQNMFIIYYPKIINQNVFQTCIHTLGIRHWAQVHPVCFDFKISRELDWSPNWHDLKSHIVCVCAHVHVWEVPQVTVHVGPKSKPLKCKLLDLCSHTLSRHGSWQGHKTVSEALNVLGSTVRLHTAPAGWSNLFTYTAFADALIQSDLPWSHKKKKNTIEQLKVQCLVQATYLGPGSNSRSSDR